MHDPALGALRVELVDALHLHAAAGGARDEGFGARDDRPLPLLARVPRVVGRAPHMEGGGIAPEDREPALGMDGVEAEDVPVEVDAPAEVRGRQRRRRLREGDHALRSTSQIRLRDGSRTANSRVPPGFSSSPAYTCSRYSS